MNERPQLLVFDLDGTLYSQRRLRRLLLPELARFVLRNPAAGWRAARILKAYREALEALRKQAPPHRLPEAQIELTCETTGYSRNLVEACIGEWFERRPLPLLSRCVRPGIEEVLSLGIPCAVLSDYDPAPKLAAMGLAGRFAAALWAGDARLRALKPYPKGLRLLLAEFGAEAERALFIGDRDEVDGAAARAAGMDYAQIGAAGFGALTRRIVTQYAQ